MKIPVRFGFLQVLLFILIGSQGQLAQARSSSPRAYFEQIDEMLTIQILDRMVRNQQLMSDVQDMAKYYASSFPQADQKFVLESLLAMPEVPHMRREKHTLVIGDGVQSARLEILNLARG